MAADPLPCDDKRREFELDAPSQPLDDHSVEPGPGIRQRLLPALRVVADEVLMQKCRAAVAVPLLAVSGLCSIP